MKRLIAKYFQNDRILKAKAFFSFLILFLLALIAPVSSPASEPFAGKIVSIENSSGPRVVNILRLGKNGYAHAKPGDDIFVSDTIKTGPNVRVQIGLSDNSVINVGPNATLTLKAYMMSPDEGKRNYVFKALKGSIRFIISKTFRAVTARAASAWKDSNVIVETPNAIAGIKGTDFVVTVNTAKSSPTVEIAVFEGSVMVRSASLSIREAVILLANQVSTVERGMKPDSPFTLTVERKDSLIRATTPAPAGTPSTTGVGAQAKGEKDKGETKERYSNADMARNIASGVPLSEVLDHATEAGMSVDQMISAALDAGADPSTLVYIAITEGYSADNVVQAAITAGVPVLQVALAAVVAGADTHSVISGATAAGASPDEVAAAVGTATTSTSPVYSYTPVTTISPETIIPTETIVIGGNPGSTASTQPASASKPRF